MVHFGFVKCVQFKNLIQQKIIDFFLQWVDTLAVNGKYGQKQTKSANIPAL